MKTTIFLFSLVCLSVSCTSENSDFISERVDDPMPLIQTRASASPVSNGYSGTYFVVKRSGSNENVFELSWTMGEYCHFTSIDVKVESPITNRWEIVGREPLSNSYVYTFSNHGIYSFYLNFYDEGRPEYALRTNREICVGTFYISNVTLPPSADVTHDYSKITFRYYEMSIDNRAVTFSGITSLANYKLVMTSPYVRDFSSVQNIYASPASQSVTFYLPEANFYRLGIYSADCREEYTKCTDYRIIEFSNAISHSGREPIDFR